MSSITVFKNDDGIELVINTETGEAFATQAGYARMSNKDRSTIVKRCKKLSESEAIKMAEIDTGYGFKLSALIPANLVFKWAIKDKPELAEAMGTCGATVYMHQLAGYEVTTKPKTPQTYLEALKALVASEEAKLLLEAENELLREDNERQAEVIDELFDYSSIIRVAKYNQCSEKAFSWRKLKAASKTIGLEVKQVPCPRFGTKNLYHHDAWRYVYPDYRLPETTTLVIKKDA